MSKRKVIVEITFDAESPQNLNLAESEIHETFTQLATSLRNQVLNVKGSVKFETIE